MVTLDVPHVFRTFNGVRGVLNLLDRYQPQHGLSYNRAQMWLQRGQIPARWVAAVLYSIERSGHHCREFFIDQDEFAPPSPGTPPNADSPRH
jgi:hypothetical protein